MVCDSFGIKRLVYIFIDAVDDLIDQRCSAVMGIGYGGFFIATIGEKLDYQRLGAPIKIRVREAFAIKVEP